MTQKEIQNIGTMKQLAMYLNALGLNDLEREEEIQEVINAVCEDKGWMPLSFDPLTKYDMAVLKYEGDDEDVYATNADVVLWYDYRSDCWRTKPNQGNVFKVGDYEYRVTEDSGFLYVNYERYNAYCCKKFMRSVEQEVASVHAALGRM